MLYLLIFIISLIGGFLSGFLGLGGAIVISPLLLLLPALFGFGEISMKAIAGLSMLQVFFGSLSGSFVHFKNKLINIDILRYVGIPLAVAALGGSYFSSKMSNITVLILFDLFILISFLMLLSNNNASNNIESSASIKINKFKSIILGTLTGTASGIIGAGGGLIMIPVFLRYYKLNIKAAIGTSLAVVFAGAVLGATGKIVSLQVDYKLVVPIIIGSLIAARAGAKVNKLTPRKTLRILLLAIVLLSFIQVSFKIYYSLSE
jgi:uncharacterized membrane protein YfcA